MALTRATGRGAAAPEDNEEFMDHLYKGGELLASGSLDEARGHLERAFELFPKNEKAQNLLGLTYFKLGMFERAAEIYELLVRENPVDPTLRVNLGLVYLKNSAVARAIREFETAVDLQPEHVKAQNYLGLALAQAGEFGRAREHFLAAGSDAMAEKMARALTEASVPPVVPPVPPAVPKQRVDVALEPVTELSMDEAEEPPPEAMVSIEEPLEPPVPDVSFEVPAEESFSGLDSDGESPAAASFESYESAPSNASMADSFEEHQLVPESAEPQRFAPLSESEPAHDYDAAPEPAGLSQDEDPSSPLTSDWGAQFGFDVDTAPAPADPFRPPEHGEPFIPPEVQGGVGEEMRFADDEGPSAADSLASFEDPQELARDEALEVAASPEPAEGTGAANDALLLSESMSDEATFESEPREPEAELVIPTQDDAPAEPFASEQETQSWMSERPAANLRAPGGGEAEPLPSLVELAHQGQMFSAPGPGPFTVEGDVVVLTVREELVTRCEGLLAYQGNLHVAPEYRRFRGRATDQAMGLPSRPMHRVRGQGRLVLEAGSAHFQATRLEDVAGYFREEVVFAFEEALTFENGRLTSDFAAEVDLVHLSGEGQVLLRLPGPLRALEVRADAPITVPLSRWVGWYGNLLPKVVALPFTLEGMEAGVELSGEGQVLLSVEPRRA